MNASRRKFLCLISASIGAGAVGMSVILPKRTSDTPSIPGLDHLEGEIVSVLDSRIVNPPLLYINDRRTKMMEFSFE